VKPRPAELWRNHPVVVLVVCTLAAAGLAIAFIWPFTDLIAAHDVGLIKGTQRALQLQTAREAVRTQLLTLGAGVLAAGALAFTAWNVTLYRNNLTLYRRTNELTEQGQVTDRYTKAIEQLGSKKLDVRIGGIYALERIARDSARDHPTVMEVLSAFIREHSHEPWPPPDHPASLEQEQSTRPDVQAAITVIGRRDRHLDDTGIGPAQAGLPRRMLARMGRIDLAGASLIGAFLFRADLAGANLERADFTGADLTGAVLAGADLTGAILAHANLFGADLATAVFNDADLSGVSLYGDHLSGTDLSGAILVGASLHGAGFADVSFFAANLTRANLTSADLTGADFADADLTQAWWPADTPVPEGWKLDTTSGRLTEAPPDSGQTEQA
jgi:uncharacterized protein YjbI with pentapeptide repeats